VRLRLAAVLALLALAVVVAGAAATPQPPKQALAIGSGGAVASVDPTATEAGIRILREGGNAVDAAIAANAALGVTEPFVAGIGGGGFVVIYLAHEHRVITIDGRETAPAAFPTNAFLDANGNPIPFFPQRVTSGMAVGVPGTLASWVQASHYGTMPLKRLLQPAIADAEHGFVVDQTFHDQIASNLTRLQAFTSSRALFLTEGQPPAVGSTFKNPELADTYRTLAHDGPGALYNGPIGAALVHTVDNPPVAPDSQLGFTVPAGVMTTADLANYTAPLRDPTHVGYRGYDVYGMGPPSSGGSTVGEALNILEGFDMSAPNRPLSLHRYLEASKLSFADRNRWVGDPGYVNVPLAGLLSEGFAAERRCLIGATALPTPVAPGDPTKSSFSGCAGTVAAVGAGPEGTSTNHLTVIDRDGNVVSWTSTIEQIAGSAIAVPHYGFLLNNELTDFDPAPATAGVPDPNLPAGGKRPRSSMAPTIVLHGGQPLLAVGSPGGATIITTVLQILLDRLDFGMSLPDAIAAPRASQRNGATQAEPAFITQYGSALAPFGQTFTSTGEIGAATGIEILPDGRLEAAAEPVRRGGGAAAVVTPSH
jgi:gamma-glutamyltranspeptidase/glutathione hydrolase